jgi:hypothetical protein
VYRDYGTHESLFLNHTVTAAGRAGIRWYEVRSPSTTPSVFQQGTYAPSDSNWRFMGSIAADQAGDVGLGFSVSAAAGGVSHPSIAWTGRLAGDPLGTMGQGETILNTGAANAPDEYAPTGRARWGDYTSMTVDPSDDCTFWYVNEVQHAAGANGWDTYIQSFKFPSCGQNDFTIAPTGGVTASQGASGSTTISTGLSKGTAESVQLTAYDLPAGATASFNPSAVTAGSSSTLTLTAGAATPPGTYTVEVSGTAPSAVHGTPVTFTVSPARTLTVTKAGSGTVTSAPAGINCGPTCAFPFADGTMVALTPTAQVGSAFTGWSGACTGSGACNVTMNQDQAVKATFAARPPVTLKVARSGHGSGSVTSSPAGISCGSKCSRAFPYGTSVTLTPHAAAGSVFAAWSGACKGASPTCHVSMTAARAVTATFAIAKLLTVVKAGAGTGTVTSAPAGISCGKTCKRLFAAGIKVTLTATATSGSKFAGWSGACSGAAKCIVTMSAAKKVKATFALCAAGHRSGSSRHWRPRWEPRHLGRQT